MTESLRRNSAFRVSDISPCRDTVLLRYFLSLGPPWVHPRVLGAVPPTALHSSGEAPQPLLTVAPHCPLLVQGAVGLFLVQKYPRVLCTPPLVGPSPPRSRGGVGPPPPLLPSWVEHPGGQGPGGNQLSRPLNAADKPHLCTHRMPRCRLRPTTPYCWHTCLQDLVAKGLNC